jgi:hypothetical protein
MFPWSSSFASLERGAGIARTGLMREPLLGYGPQGLALEVNPWQTKALVDAIHLFRGAIVSAWANVDTALIEVTIRASCHPAYADARADYPSKFKGRTRYLRKILSMPGPLSEFRGLGEAVLARYEAGSDMRNMMAHARVTQLLDRGATFSGFLAKSGHEISWYQRRFSRHELEAMAVRATRFSRAVLGLLARIDARELLPTLDAAA